MAESVDALVSNTSGATRAGSTPALGTEKEKDFSSFSFFLFTSKQLISQQIEDLQRFRGSPKIHSHNQFNAVSFQVSSKKTKPVTFPSMYSDLENRVCSDF